MRSAIDLPALEGVTLLGVYAFDHAAEAMRWTPVLANLAEASAQARL